MEEYIKYKLRLKIETHLSLMGKNEFELWLYDKNWLSQLVNKVKLLGMYKIIWKNDLPVDIEMIDPKYQIEVQSGKYYILDEGRFVAQLYSSEFIDFTLRELRDYKLEEIIL